MAKLPNFLIIGAARAGTTALYAYLKQSPVVFMPSVKEPNFFAFEGQKLDCQGPGADYINNSVTTLDAYQRLFAAAPADAICGEASPLYLYADQAPTRIHAHVPGVRMIAVLRNPVEQAYSHFLFATKQRIEPETDFVRALELEDERLANGWQPLFGYSRFPRYGEQLARYLAMFPRDQFLIRPYEDFQTDPKALVKDIFGFIGAPDDFEPTMPEGINAGGIPKNAKFQDFLMKPNPVTGAIGRVVPKDLRWKIRDRLAGFNLKRNDGMPEAARSMLVERLSDDVHQLQDLLQADFSHWLK